MSKRPATLRSIAEQLNVHVSTVSRILNGDTARIASVASKETIERIRELAASLGYQPNPHAISLKTRHSREIAVLVPQLSDIVLANIYEGIDAAACDYGYTAFVANTLDRPERQRQLAEKALARNVEGLIISDAHCTPEEDFIGELEKQRIPLVLVSRRKGELCSVTSNDGEGGRMAAQHLFEQGHTRVGIIAGQAHSSNALERVTHFLDYYRERGITILPHNIIHGPFDAATGFAIGETLLAQPERPTAIFAVNDFLAIGLFGAMRNRGLIPGQDIAVVGYNDTPLAAHLQIPLTSISTCMYEQGYLAVETLLRRIAGESVESYRFPAVMTIRASSQCRPR
ncbi:LacI family transcriptional regulator [Brenneria roseae subsp. roseae]|uniref:LacI family DNA-binding transcriptional regulator n=1 Tax=Brenneria roseae TaxID=1509241 RepID=UPI000D62144C|nr:LacI family DNA-binding transcriptional regulator [Brenneria roseae]PWC22790.1 LacI family transcriptional regulator [Brenneria roseae subsp. roseae]